MKRFIKWVLISLLAFSSLFVIYYVNKINILETKYFIPFIVFVLLFGTLNIFKLIRKKTRKGSKIFFAIFSSILIILYTIICRFTGTTISFLKKITNLKTETVNYNVLVLKNAEYKEILDITDKNIGFIGTDLNLKDAQNELNNKMTYKKETYDDIGSLVGALYNNKVNAITVNEAYIHMLEDSDNEFVKNYKVLYKYSVRVSIKDNSTKKLDYTKDPFIIYISGTDSRGTVSDVSRSDVNIIAVVNPTNHKILLVSTPRDYYVQLHGTTGIKDKLTHAGVYGIDMSKNTMQDLLDIKINNVIKASFKTVVNVVDTIDGITINSDTEFTATSELTKNKCHYIVGEQELNGDCALRYARERKTYSTGDRHRGQNQQQVITAIVEKMTNPKYMIRYNDILRNIEGTIETDISYDSITELAKYELSNLSSWKVESISLDGDGAMLPTYSMGEDLPLYVMIPNEDSVNIAKEKIKEYLKKN